MIIKKSGLIMAACTLILVLTGCTSTEDSANINESTVVVIEQEVENEESSTEGNIEENVEASLESNVEQSEMFTDRDMVQTFEEEDAIYFELESEQEIIIDTEGVYIFSGQVSESTIVVDADDEEKVQIVLDGVSIVNADMPAIYVRSADKVFVTTTDSNNYLQMTGDGASDDGSNLDAVIYAKDDLVINGLGTIEIISSYENGISAKDDLKITGGVLVVTAQADGIEANDSIRVNGGDLIIESGKDAIHCENEDDSSLGYIYIKDSNIYIMAEDDAIRATTFVQVDSGSIEIETCAEGIEATYIQINEGTIKIYATDDGINATSKSDAYDVLIEINGGDIAIEMASGDTDGFDSNGDIMIYGGTINVDASSAFDANGYTELVAGEVIVNGEVMTEIVQTQMGGRNHK